MVRPSKSRLLRVGGTARAPAKFVPPFGTLFELFTTKRERGKGLGCLSAEAEGRGKLLPCPHFPLYFPLFPLGPPLFDLFVQIVQDREHSEKPIEKKLTHSQKIVCALFLLSAASSSNRQKRAKALSESFCKPLKGGNKKKKKKWEQQNFEKLCLKQTEAKKFP